MKSSQEKSSLLMFNFENVKYLGGKKNGIFIQNFIMQHFLSFFLINTCCYWNTEHRSEFHFIFQTMTYSLMTSENLQCNLRDIANNIHVPNAANLESGKSLLDPVITGLGSGINLVRAKKAANLPSSLFCISVLLYYCLAKAGNNSVDNFTVLSPLFNLVS